LLKSCIGLLLLILQNLILNSRGELLRRVSHDNARDALVVGRTETPQDLRALRRDQVILDLHHDVVAGHHGSDRIDQAASAVVIHHRNTEIEVGPVI
jgi:hypothetical protein